MNNYEKEIICEKAYLYMFQDGELKIYEGYVANTLANGRGFFYLNDEKKYYSVKDEPCTYYANTLWLKQKNLKLAKKIFTNYYKDKIEETKEKLTKYKKTLKAFK